MIHLGLVVAIAAQVAQWQPFQVQFAQSVMGKTVLLSLDGGKAKKTFAGKLGFRDRDGAGLSVCANVRAPIHRGRQFTVRPMWSSKAGGNVGLAGRIVGRHFRAAQTPDQCAGLQLAVWEAVEDGGSRPGFLQGRFQARANSAVLAFAEMYYAAVDEPKGDAVFLLAPKGEGQSQLMPPAVDFKLPGAPTTDPPLR